MAEILGAASAVAGLISLGEIVLSQGYAFAASVRRAPKELKALLSESAAIDTLLDQIQCLVDESTSINNESVALTNLVQAGLINECKESLLFVQRSIERCQQQNGEEVRNFAKRAIWPFKERETKEALARLSRLRGHLATAVTVDMTYRATLRSVSKFSQGISAGVNELREWTVKHQQDEQLRSLLKWLNPNSVHVEDNLKQGLDRHHPGTCQWIFHSECFKLWSNGPSSALWVYGLPGSGKTVLTASNKRTLQYFLTVGILQLLDQHPDDEDKAASLFQKYGSDTKKAIRVDDQLTLFAGLAQNFRLVTVVIDALDECKELDNFARGLEKLIAATDNTTRLLITSRTDHSLETSVGALATYRISLEHNIDCDIETFVTDEVNSRIESRKLKIGSPQLKDLVIHSLSYHADGMFLWVNFQLDLISGLTNDKAIREALNRLPRGLENTYIRLLTQIKDRNARNLEIVVKSLMWIVSSLEPLTLGQLAEAITIEPEDTHRDSEKMINDEKDLLEILGSLVTVDLSQEDPIISLTHFILDEFLQSDTLRAHESLWMFYIPFQSELNIMITCFQYMSFSDFKTRCYSRQELLQRKSSYKLLEFAAKNCLSLLTAYRARVMTFKKVLQVMAWFIEPCRDNNEQFISWLQAFHDDVDCLSTPIDPLFYVGEFYNVYLYGILLQRGADPNFLYQEGFTELHVAVLKGREERVAQLLQTALDLEDATGRGHTALHLAAELGHVGVIRLLLEAGASPHAQTDTGSTPFYRAARSGSITAIELLYEAGSDVNAKPWDEWTPVLEAIENSQVPSVEWLVHKGARLNHRILHSPSVLQFAKSAGNEEIIRIIEDGLSRR